jgi:UDP-glucose 4-epimerase
MTKIKSVLLTGGTGYIGSHTAIVLMQAGHDVVLFDNFCNSRRDVVTRMERIADKPLAMVEGDVRDHGLLINTLRRHEIDAVIHFAGLKAVGESVARPLDYYANNVQGTINLLESMQTVGTKTLVFSSSATVYGNPLHLPIDEMHPLSPTNPYGRSKLYIEEILRDLCRSDEGWRVACLRYFNPVGAHESGLIGEDPQGIPNNLMPFIAKVAVGQLPQLSIFGDDYDTPDGTGVRDYIHVMDLAEGHQAALHFLQKQTGWHAINLGTGRGYSVLEMVNAFEEASGKKVAYRIAPRRAGDVATCYANPAKALEQLSWQAKRGLSDMCVSTWHWQGNQKNGCL